MPTERGATVRAVSLLLALLLWAHGTVVVVMTVGVPVQTPHHDNVDGAAPLRVEAARQWKSGEIPLWNPWKRVGMPLLADTTAGALYPGNFPFLLTSDTGDSLSSPALRALDQVAVINTLLGGVFMFVFLRVLAVGYPGAMLAGLVFACSGTMQWFAGWYIQIQSSAVWLPLILAAVHSAGGAAVAKWTFVGASAVALQFFAGFPETSFYSGVIAIAYAASLAVSRRSGRPLVAVGVIYAAGLMLSAIQLLPSIELESLSRRPGELPLDVFQSLPASVSMFRAWAVLPAEAGLEFPPPSAYHFGAVAVVAAVIGAVASFRRAAFFVALLVIGALLSLGAATPANELLHRLPGFNAFRHPFKHLFEVCFAMSVLAGLGLDRLIGAVASTENPGNVTKVLVAAACTAALFATGMTLGRNNVEMVASGIVLGADPEPFTLASIEPGWRVLAPRQVFQSRDSWRLIGDYPSQFQVRGINGAGPFLWQPLAEKTGMIEEETTFRRGLFDGRDRTLALLSGRYLFQARHGQRFIPAADPDAWKVVRATPDGQIVERKDALPRHRFVGEARCATDERVRASLEGAAEDPADVALVDCTSAARSFGPFHSPASLALEVESESPGSLVLRTAVPDGASAFLVVGQSDFPGWHAGTDGRRAQIHRVHGLVQGIELPAGTKRVELRYMPLGFLVGTAMSAATLVVLLLWCLVSRRTAAPSQG